MQRALRVVIALSVLTSSAPCFAAEGWLGTWTLNVAKSKYSPGPPPKEWSLTYERTPAGIKLTAAGVDASGQKGMNTYVAPFDGSEVARSGDPNPDAATPLKLNDNAFVSAIKKGGKLIYTVHVNVSADGKTLTVTQTGNVNIHAVYERKP